MNAVAVSSGPLRVAPPRNWIEPILATACAEIEARQKTMVVKVKKVFFIQLNTKLVGSKENLAKTGPKHASADREGCNLLICNVLNC